MEKRCTKRLGAKPPTSMVMAAVLVQDRVSKSNRNVIRKNGIDSLSAALSDKRFINIHMFIYAIIG